MIPLFNEHTHWLTKRMEKLLSSNGGYNKLKSVKISPAYKTFSTKKEVDELTENPKCVIVSNSVRSMDGGKKSEENKIVFRSLRSKSKKNIGPNRPVLPAVLLTFDKNQNNNQIAQWI